MEAPAYRSRIARSFLCVIIALAVTGFTATAAAQYLGTVFSGLWSTPGEAGSGVTATHEEPVFFLTFFIYRSGRAPYWLTATVTPGAPIQGARTHTPVISAFGGLRAARFPGNALGFPSTDSTSGQLVVAAMQQTVAGFTAILDVQASQRELLGTISGIVTTPY